MLWVTENLVNEDGLTGFVPELERQNVNFKLTGCGIGPAWNTKDGTDSLVLKFFELIIGYLGGTKPLLHSRNLVWSEQWLRIPPPGIPLKLS